MALKLLALEVDGLVAPQPCVDQVFAHLPNGPVLLEALRSYEASLAGTDRYEPGSVYALALPFLLHHDFPSRRLSELAASVRLVPGAGELCRRLASDGWQLFIVSVAYERYARGLAERLGVPPAHVLSTRFPLRRYQSFLSWAHPDAIKAAGVCSRETVRLWDAGERKGAVQVLDSYFRVEVERDEFGSFIRSVRPLAARRKVIALRTLARSLDHRSADFVVLGASAVDAEALLRIKRRHGLAIAVNAEETALASATIGVATHDLLALEPVLRAWTEGGLDAVRGVVAGLAPAGARYDWLEGADLRAVVTTHREARRALLVP